VFFIRFLSYFGYKAGIGGFDGKNYSPLSFILHFFAALTGQNISDLKGLAISTKE
jgi:hypothetical protein